MSKRSELWVIDDDRSIRWVLEKAFEKADMDVVTFAGGEEVLGKLAQHQPDVLLSDIRMPGINGLELLQRIQNQYPNLPVIIMTAHSDMDSALAAYRGGAFEYLPKPFDVDDAVALVRRAISHRYREQPGQLTEPSESMPEIVGKAPSMQRVFRAIGRLSNSNVSVLISGESGTGKELVAQALHRHSPRASGPFVALNMAAIPRDLLESELFGHEKGAFTGAQSRRIGRFEQANGGLLLLDEIGDMPAELQTRLLRVLADGEFYRVGAHNPTKVDVRIIAATHQDLESKVKEGTFREDLFHRLNVIRIHVPPLRERREDVPLLLHRFLVQAARELNVETKVLLPDAEQKLVQLDWPGNVRQLENLCRWLTVMASGQEIHLHDLPPELNNETDNITVIEGAWQSALRRWADQRLEQGEEGLLQEAMPEFERIMIETALGRTGGRRQDAARLLGWGRNTLSRKIKELGLENQ
jgi:two-component system nitrogen regulation response regulator GlnG